MHAQEPLFSDSQKLWRFLSAKYEKIYLASLKSLGVNDLSHEEALSLFHADAFSITPTFEAKPLQDMWHDSFLTFVQHILNLKNGTFTKQIRDRDILPVRVLNELQWYPPSSTVYYPTVVEEGTGSDSIKIEMPTGLDLVVLHPDSAKSALRRRVYGSLGVSHCTPETICKAIERYHRTSGTKFDSDLVASLELPFWFSHKFSLEAQRGLIASTAGGIYANTRGLFMRSTEPYHAECLADLHKNDHFQKYFLHSLYKTSQVSTRSRGGYTWEKWLQSVAGVRVFPPLEDQSDENKLHFILEAVRERDSAVFVTVIQTYWAQEYALTCKLHDKTKQALMRASVACLHGKREELQKTWFPSSLICETANYYGIRGRLPILALPESKVDYSISEWSCLPELGVRANPDLQFYRQSLSLLSTSNGVSDIDASKIEELYKKIGEKATLNDKEALSDEFRDNPLVWDPISVKWRTLGECLWSSPISLKCVFVLTSRYRELQISSLFQTLLDVGDITSAYLIDELLYMQKNDDLEPGETPLSRASRLYALLKDMVKTNEDKKWLRSQFDEKDLVYSSATRRWLKPESCLWSTTVEIGDHVPIAGIYPDLEDFFVKILKVSTVTDAFMMKELAATASKPIKSAEVIKRLMSSTSKLLNINSDVSKFDKSIEILQQHKFLPCRACSGQTEFRSISEVFFIMDNQHYAEKFAGKLVVLDISYEELNSLHQLFRILRLDDRYVTRHVREETSALSSEVDDVLTEQFRQCVYAISCCAISHRSSVYAGQSTQMHQKLMNAVIRTSPDISTKLVVEQDQTEIKIETSRASIIIQSDENSLSITLPSQSKERRRCMRSQLPGHLVEMLQICDSRGQTQIYRIINELDSGTDEILLDEQISETPWIAKTARATPVSRVSTPPPQSILDGEVQVVQAVRAGTSPGGARIQVPYIQEQTYQDVHLVEVTARSTNFSAVYDRTVPPATFRPLPTEINHTVQAPDYWKVLEHVADRAALMVNRLRRSSDLTTDDLINSFASLRLQSATFEPADYPSLFGNDVWLSKFRVGAAGELLIYEMLRRLLPDMFTLDNWHSRIRYWVQASERFRHVSAWQGREIADIMYPDQGSHMENLLRSKVVGDDFPGRLPGWLASPRQDNSETLEWLFEVKTTIGPCETDFFMSPDQYERMRTLGRQTGPGRKQVYCIVRVYNLLDERIGVRFFIDPWRLRDTRLDFGTTEKWKVKALP